jgi:hypothetical protein
LLGENSNAVAILFWARAPPPKSKRRGHSAFPCQHKPWAHFALAFDQRFQSAKAVCCLWQPVALDFDVPVYSMVAEHFKFKQTKKKTACFYSFTVCFHQRLKKG